MDLPFTLVGFYAKLNSVVANGGNHLPLLLSDSLFGQTPKPNKQVISGAMLLVSMFIISDAYVWQGPQML